MLDHSHVSNFFFWLISSGIIIAVAVFTWLLIEYIEEGNDKF